MDGANGKRTIAPDPGLASAITRLFEQYATEKYSLKQIAKIARAEGLAYRKSGDMVPTSTVHKILRNRVYTADFDFDGTSGVKAQYRQPFDILATAVSVEHRLMAAPVVNLAKTENWLPDMDSNCDFTLPSSGAHSDEQGKH